MGIVKPPSPVKPFVAFIFRQEECLSKARGALSRLLGPVDCESDVQPFTHTDYYQKEFGAPLWRVFTGFARLIRPDELALLKCRTNRLEKRLSSDGARLINCDPGYLDAAKVVLATTKDYRHRVYLGKGIYGEVTLFYSGNTYQPWEWTYPDYRIQSTLSFFNALRRAYVTQKNDRR